MNGKKTTVRAGALLGLLGGALAHANPQGGAVVSGQATFAHPSPGTLNVTNSNGAILHWQSFSIGAQETTRFIQPSAASAVLNRVVGQNPSEILGQLLSNGRVYLINPNGIVFGPGSRVDTAGLIASTLNMSDEDFKAGRLKFQGDASSGSIKNQGYIKAGPGGEVVLIAPRIENSGIIEAPDGKLLLAAGQSVNLASLDFDDIVFEVQAPENEVVNLGQLIAERGTIGVFAGGIRNSGTISADSASVNDRGQIVLSAQSDIRLESTSTITANGPAGGEIRIDSKEGTTWVSGNVAAVGNQGKGGSVQLLGERVAVLDGATVDASGKRGGGKILVGGDYQGKNPEVHNAKQTYVAPDATLKADALKRGKGGKVIVWGDETTQAYGQISAKGGAKGGNGGFIETSGAWLDVNGIRVNASAPLGKGGEWLLDPNNITIDSAFTVDSNVSKTGTSPFLIASTGDSAEVMVSTIANALDAGFNVTIQTSGGGTEAGNINVNALIDPPFSSTGTNDTTLTFNAHNDININAGITWANFKLNMVLNADSDNSGGGAVNLGSGITLDANGGTINAAGEIVNVLSGLVTINSPFLAGTLNVNTAGNAITGTGDITTGTLNWKFGNILGTTGSESLTTNGVTTLTAVGPPPCFPCPISAVTLGRNWINNGTVNHTFGQLELTASGQFTNNAGATYNLSTATGDMLLAGGSVFDNAGTLNVNSGGSVEIGAGGSFNNSGTVNVDSGTLTLSANDVAGDTGAYNVASGATLVFFEHDRNFLAGSSIHGAGNVNFESSNSNTFIIDGTYDVSGLTYLYHYLDVFFNTDTTLGQLTMEEGAFDAPYIKGTGSITVAGDFNWIGGTSFGGNIQGAGTFTTLGNTVLSGTATKTVDGRKWINYGNISLTGGNLDYFSAPSFDMKGGSLTLAGGTTMTLDDIAFNWDAGVLAGSGDLALTGGLSVLNISGAGARVLNGLNLTLPTLNLNGGSLDIQSGSLDVTGATTIASGASLALAGGANNFGGLITNNGTWKIATPITLNDFTNNGLMLLDSGAVLTPGTPGPLFKNAQGGVLGGTGTIANDLLNEGTLSPGHSPDTLNITGNLILGPTSILNLELGGNQQGQSYDLINVSGTAALDGTLNIALFGNFLPLLGANFDVINYSSATGSFAQVNSPSIFPFTTSNFGSFFRLTSQGVRFPPGTNPIDAILAMGGDRPPSVPPLTTQVAGIGISGEEAIRIIGFQQCP